ncbi:hypothetical protein OG795_33080 (plasmid) [[Kitasatospora] papulosa]|uniref:hypothetical protein n=1 Tax=[Kitasatospora] papulosa TaxID=1464011 RepID=UPI002F90DEBD
MQRLIISAVLAAALVPVAAALVPVAAALVPVAAAPASSAPRAYVDERVRDCPGKGPGCRPGAVAHYWYKRGSTTRGVGWVYASREGMRSGTARWLVKKPGGTWKAGGAWKRAGRVV